jgi:cystathionine beta-lyase family protein involved in aluminum resistance
MKQSVMELSRQVEQEIKSILEKVDSICEINSRKVLRAFQECKLQEAHLNSSTGYGIDEPGRNKIEEIYSNIFKAEDSLVRSQLISGTHALAITLSALLRPGDTMISISGEPYDTLQTVIGIGKEKSRSSLKAFNIGYEQIDLVENEFDIPKIQERLKKQDIKLVEIQRSRGYSTRKSLTIEKIEKVIQAIREVNKDVIIMVDNCYGEFVQDREPIEVGADIAVRFINEKFRSWYCNFRCIYCR